MQCRGHNRRTRRSSSDRWWNWYGLSDPQELAQGLEPCYETISNWVKQADQDEGRTLSGLTTEELSRLHRENCQLKLEWEILVKATAWFAWEAGSLPRSTSS